MTEEEWLSGTNLMGMLGFLVARLGPSPEAARKLRLFACAACRRLWHLLKDERSRQAVEVSELYADGLASRGELEEAARAAEVAAVAAAQRAQLGWNAARTAAEAAGEVETAAERAAAKVGDLETLRDIFGNPFRAAALDPAWLNWNHGCVVAVAQSLYQERAFADLPILADALQDAGCAEEDILVHCRSGERHVRGCWVVDALLGQACPPLSPPGEDLS
jgi:hypothetical protein